MTAPARAGADASPGTWVGVVLEAAADGIVAERGYVLHWCEAVEDANPLWWDEAVAQDLTGGWIAPPSMLSVWMRPLQLRPRGGTAVRPLELHFRLKEAFGLPHGIVGANEITFHEPVRMGDRITTRQTVRDIGEQRTNRLGTGRSWTIDVTSTNQRGDLVGVERYAMWSYQEDGADGARRRAEPTGAGCAGAPLLDRAGTAGTPSGGLRFDDVHAGDALPPLVVPVTARTVVMGASASRDWQPQHHDHAWAVENVGPRGIFLNTPTQAGWIERYLTGWTGASGRLGRLAFRMRRTVCPGDVATFRGTVTATAQDDRGCGWIDLDIEVRTGEGVATRCTARIAIPRDGDDNPWRRRGVDWTP